MQYDAQARQAIADLINTLITSEGNLAFAVANNQLNDVPYWQQRGTMAAQTLRDVYGVPVVKFQS